MTLGNLRWVSRHPGAVVAGWLLLAVTVTVAAPDLTRLAAEGQAHLVPELSESAQASRMIRQAWPDQWYDSTAVVALSRNTGLTGADRDYARSLDQAFRTQTDRPEALLRVLGPGSPSEIADRLYSPDGTTQLLVLPISESFVSPATGQAVTTLQEIQRGLPAPEGLRVLWTGDAVLGRDYMARVKDSLDRAAIVTVFLLLIVLLVVYRSLLLALIPLVTIGVGVLISRSVLSWMVLAGWEVSPLVELFLIVILFGCGTDFCLFLSWRFGEHWNPSNPAGAMRVTLLKTITPLLTSAGTVIGGLTLMRVTQFKLFSTTGPSVALGLALTLGACLTLAPALLILLARWRPRAFTGLTAPSSGFWHGIARQVMRRPFLTWLGTLLVMAPIVAVSLFNEKPYAQDTFGELPWSTPSLRALREITDPTDTQPTRKFRMGELAPLTVLLQADTDWTRSEGLALIDDVSRLLSHQRRLLEVRSATQPLGSAQPLERARLASRLKEINEGFTRLSEGAEALENGLIQGGAKLRTAMMLEDLTGLSLTGTGKPARLPPSDPLASGLKQATSSLFGVRRSAPPPAREPSDPPPAPGPQDVMLRDLAQAAQGARQIAEGARRAQSEVTAILSDPVGRRALDKLLITPRNREENPELEKSFEVYISPDRSLARIDLVQADRLCSAPALDQVETLRRRIGEYLAEEDAIPTRALFTGANAQGYDIRDLTRQDQSVTWFVVPIAVFLILLVAHRDVGACVNLVATMILTYSFAMGVTHLLFVTILGADGIDWKVPYFLFVLLVAVGVDYNVFLMSRMEEEVRSLGLRSGITRAVAQTGGLITSAAAITACSFASFLSSPLGSIRQLGFALVVGILVDALLVRPVLVPCGQWLLHRNRSRGVTPRRASSGLAPRLARVAD
jgi:RND superfamily putative drug exporter